MFVATPRLFFRTTCFSRFQHSRYFCSTAGSTIQSDVVLAEKPKRKPHGFWKNKQNHKEFLNELAQKLQIESEEQWSQVSSKQIREHGGTGFLLQYRTFYEALRELFPERNWTILDNIEAKHEQMRKQAEAMALNPDQIPEGDMLRKRPRKPRAPGKDLMLSQVWNESIDPTGYWISEKYDGMRAFWSGEILASRYGRKLSAPSWWLEKLPSIPMDGELWVDYDQFGTLLTLVKRTDDSGWNQIKFMVFDSPSETEDFETRIARLKENVVENDAIKLVKYTKCTGVDHLKQELLAVVKRGGEGLMIRKPEASYYAGRSYNMLKVKLQLDSEAKMLRKAKKCVGYDVELPNGVEIIIRCTYTDYRYPPAPGTVLQVKHFGYWGSGKLKNPFFWRMRTDGITWDEVLEQYKSGNTDYGKYPYDTDTQEKE